MAMMLDQLASYARTALDDPGVMIDEQGREVTGAAYAIDRLDEVINTINPALIDAGSAATALTVLGRHMADIAERIGEELENSAARDRVTDGLDAIDEAIALLRPEPEPDGARCDQCGRPMNPAARMLGPVCGECCRANHREVAR